MTSLLSGQALESVAILDIEGRGISALEAASLTDRLRADMVRTGRATIVERGQMEQILNEQDFHLAGCTSEECAVEVGELLGVTTMIAGAIGKVGSTYSIDLRIIDVTTGQIVNSISRDYRGEIDGLLDEMAGLADDVVNFLDPTGVTQPQPQPEPPPVVIQQPTPQQQPQSMQQPVARGRSGFMTVMMMAAAAAAAVAYYVLTVTDDPGTEPFTFDPPPALPATPGGGP